MTAALAKPAPLPFSSSPLSPVLGAEVTGFDVRTLRPSDAAAIMDHVRDTQVLVFRDQNLTPADLVRYLKLFGEPQYHVLKQFLMEEAPEIYVLSNLKQDDKPVGNAYEGLSWHTDLDGQMKNTAYTVLYGVEVTSVGGPTRFASMYKAYEALPAEKKKRLEGLKSAYSYGTQYTMRLEYLAAKGITDHQYDKPLTQEQQEYAKRKLWTPIVDTNPYNGRKWLHMSVSGCAGVEGMSDEDGLKYVQDLVDYAVSEPFRYDHQWRKGDVVMWDNRGLFHSAGDFDRKTQRRLLWRGSIADA